MRHGLRATSFVAASMVLCSLIGFVQPAAAAVRCFGERPTITGDHGPDILRGTPEKDVIMGFGGRDRIDGRGGDDLLCGGDDNDALEGGDGKDRLDGDGGGDRLDGGEGGDVLVGGGSPAGVRDAAIYSDERHRIEVDLIRGRVGTFSGRDDLTGIDAVAGSPFSDLIGGSAGNELLLGGGGDDLMGGFGGRDILKGQDGNDELLGDLSGDVLDGGDNGSVGDTAGPIDTGGQGAVINLKEGIAFRIGRTDLRDTLRGIENAEGSINRDLLTGDAGANTLSGVTGNDLLIGLGGDDTLLGGGGDDRLAPGAGYKDQVDGGAGTDEVSMVADPVPIIVDLVTNRAKSPLGEAKLEDIENAVGSVLTTRGPIFTPHNTLIGDGGPNELRGGPYGNVMVGNGGDDVLISRDSDGGARDALYGDFCRECSNEVHEVRSQGTAGDDRLLAGPAPDSLIGGGGNDELVGGPGTDQAYYARAPSGVTVNLADGTATGEGNDTLSTMEDIYGSKFDDVLTGNRQANYIFGWNGDDEIHGGPANDYLDGWVGRDPLFGEEGNDDECRRGYVPDPPDVGCERVYEEDA